MKIISLSQSVDVEKSIDAASGEFLNEYAQEYNRLAATFDSAMGELRNMSSEIVRDNNFNDERKTISYYIGNDGVLTRLQEKMKDVDNKFNKLVLFIKNQKMTPIDKKNILMKQMEEVSRQEL